MPGLGSVLTKPNLSRKHLSRYSWIPDIIRIEGSIITRVAGPVLTLTLFASGVAYAWSQGRDVNITNSVTPLLAVVVGLILVFRNGTSYDRFYEGRKDWGAMSSDIRNLARNIWISVCLPHDEHGHVPQDTPAAIKLRKQKINLIKLVLAFAYATKHHLREEEGLGYEDYVDVLPESFTRLTFGSVTGVNHKTASPTGMSTPTHEGMHASYDSVAGTTLGRGATGSSKRGISQASHPAETTNLLSDSHMSIDVGPAYRLSLPMIIAHEISRTIFRFKRAGYLDNVGPAGMNGMNGLVQSMLSQLTSMERIVTTPIPISYGIHLKQCVSLYLFSLPFTLVRDLGWGTIPVVTVVAFTLMGIEGIANEIEMPFGRDKSDLPLDKFCAELKEELMCIIERLPEGGEGSHGFGFDDDDNE